MDRALCLFTSGMVAGAGTSITMMSVPSIKASSDPLPAWKKLYKIGSKFVPAMILVTSGVAIKLYLKTEDNRYLAVAGSNLLIVPYTILFMKSTNDALFAIEDNEYRENNQEEEKVRKLIKSWATLQCGRTTLGLVGFVITILIGVKKCK